MKYNKAIYLICFVLLLISCQQRYVVRLKHKQAKAKPEYDTYRIPERFTTPTPKENTSSTTQSKVVNLNPLNKIQRTVPIAKSISIQIILPQLPSEAQRKHIDPLPFPVKNSDSLSTSITIKTRDAKASRENGKYIFTFKDSNTVFHENKAIWTKPHNKREARIEVTTPVEAQTEEIYINNVHYKTYYFFYVTMSMTQTSNPR